MKLLWLIKLLLEITTNWNFSGNRCNDTQVVAPLSYYKQGGCILWNNFCKLFRFHGGEASRILNGAFTII
jgi:hypothetical protein